MPVPPQDFTPSPTTPTSPPASPATAGSTVIGLEKVFFEIHPPKELDKSPAAITRALLALTQLRKSSILDRLAGKIENMTLEIAVVNSLIHFYAIVPMHLAKYFEGQITASYPKARVIKLDSDYLHDRNLPNLMVKQLVLAYPYYFPLNTYKTEKDTDPLASVLGTLSSAQPDETLVFQINLAHGGRWQGSGRAVIERGIPITNPDGTKSKQPHPQAKLIEEKIKQNGFEVSMRILSSAPDSLKAQSNLANLASSFGSLSMGEGNSLKLAKPSLFFNTDPTPAFFLRTINPHQSHQYLNVDEIATLYHLPDILTSQIKNIAWGGESFNDPPQNLPVATGLSDEEKKNINFFAKTEFKNADTIFGIKEGEDRRRHFYIIGKTGTGKSTLIANMAISDIRKDKGIAIIDPHGDLSEIIINYIPAHRVGDIAYLDPSYSERSFHLNPFEIKDLEDADLVTSNFISIFQKLYSYTWGPRLEYILRNTILTLAKRPGSTMLDIPVLLTDMRFRRNVVANIADPVLRNFWQNEYDRFAENFRQEAISPILNKIGQFLSSQKIRNIVGHEKSTVDLSDIMNSGKVLILNLSQGKLGEDNAALLGALFITKFQLAAAARAAIPEKERRDFFLFVDEFQNFATTSFIKILSEARKYHLNLVLANQYMAQLSEEIQKAIFGNVGTIVSFVVGAADAKALAVEFGTAIPENELVALDKYVVALRLSIDSAMSPPFLAHTLALPESSNQQRDKVLAASLERYTKPVVADVAPPPASPTSLGGPASPASLGGPVVADVSAPITPSTPTPFVPPQTKPVSSNQYPAASMPPRPMPTPPPSSPRPQPQFDRGQASRPFPPRPFRPHHSPPPGPRPQQPPSRPPIPPTPAPINPTPVPRNRTSPYTKPQ